MSEKKKIAFVGNTSFSMYNFRMGVMRHFMRDYEVVVIAPEDEYSDFFRNEGIRYIPVAMETRGTNVISDMGLLKTLYRCYKEEKFDFVFHYTIKPVIYGSIACRLLSIKCISVVTGLGYTFMRENLLNKLVKNMYRVALRKVLQVWFLNRDDREVFVNDKIVDEAKTFVLNGEGIDMDHFQSMEKQVNDGKFRFLLIARLIKEKGIREYADAAKRLKAKYPDMIFSILGKMDNGVDDNISSEEIDEWVRDGYIDYKGYSMNVCQHIADSDCVVLPSYREGIPRSLMEAMSMKKPIIASNSVGCVELIEDGVNGYKIEPKSSDDLLEKMERLYHLSEEERAAMGQAGFDIVANKFDEKIIISIYREKIKDYLL